MKETTKQSISILTITLIFAVSIFVLNKFTLVSFSEYQQNRIEIQEKQEALIEVENFRKLAEELNNKYNSMGGDFYKVAEAIPTSPRFSELLAIVDSIARQTGVSVKDISFRDIPNKKVNSDLYSLVEISLNISGDYTNISLFFAEIEKELRLMDTTSLTIKSLKSLTNRNVKEGFLDANVIIQSYYQSIN
jgi:Tfp pilus assembly protein PilO